MSLKRFTTYGPDNGALGFLTLLRTGMSYTYKVLAKFKKNVATHRALDPVRGTQVPGDPNSKITLVRRINRLDQF